MRARASRRDSQPLTSRTGAHESKDEIKLECEQMWTREATRINFKYRKKRKRFWENKDGPKNRKGGTEEKKGTARIEVRNIKGLRGSKIAIEKTISSRKKKKEDVGCDHILRNPHGDRSHGRATRLVQSKLNLHDSIKMLPIREYPRKVLEERMRAVKAGSKRGLCYEAKILWEECGRADQWEARVRRTEGRKQFIRDAAKKLPPLDS